jgi:hypothetical protein
MEYPKKARVVHTDYNAVDEEGEFPMLVPPSTGTAKIWQRDHLDAEHWLLLDGC